ncbi:MAG: hypothetical protein WCD42_01585 [Rhizomicrobium sp.]
MLLCHEGFDHEAGYADMARHSGAVTWSAGTNGFVTGRDGLGRALTTRAGLVTATLASRLMSQFCGFAWRLDGTCTLSIGDSVAGAMQAVITFGGVHHDVSLTIDGTVVWTSAADLWLSGGWYFIEVWPVIAASGGSVTLRINDGNILSHCYSGKTQVTANAVWDSITWDGSASTGDSPVDDFYACDTAKASGYCGCNSFLGDTRTLSVFAIGTDAAGWIPGVPSDEDIFPALSANANWQQVCETALDNSRFNASGTVGAEDRFNFAPFPNYLGAVLAATVVTALQGNGNATAAVAPLLAMGGAKSYAASHIPAVSGYVYTQDQWTKAPDGSLLTLMGLNAVAAGYRLQALG